MSSPDIEMEPAPLLSWYRENGRKLPWRVDTTPYHVWISEIMLQQTRVEAVKGYYDRFLGTLPDVMALSKAEEDVCLKLWEGLGYYSRVRNIHKAAKVISENYGGVLPGTYDELRKLPGIGAYTAAAVASIAYGEKVPAIDGNLLRVFARLTRYEENIKTGRAMQAAAGFYEKMMEKLPQKQAGEPGVPGVNPAGDLNQALMDLGAMVCVPGTVPHCAACPYEAICRTHNAEAYRGCENKLPVLPEKKARRVENRTVFVIRDGASAVLRKRPDKGLLADLFEFPNTEGELDRDAAVEYIRSLGLEPLYLSELPPHKHVFSHVEWHMTGYSVRVDVLRAFPKDTGLLLVPAADAEANYSIPSAFAHFAAYADIDRQRPKSENAERAKP